jgi:hypothetical protein
MATVGIASPVTVTWTLAGEPGSVESIVAMAVEPDTAGTLSVDDAGAISFTGSAEATGVIVKIVGDNVAGTTVGALSIQSDPFDVVAAPPVLTADAGTIVVG